MSDGCWVQFWDHVDFAGPTLRIDAEGPVLFVEDMDDYTQSDGSKEGDEPDSLRTGSRTWLVIYEKKGYEGRQAAFGPNSEVPDLQAYAQMRGEASSFKIYDYAPPGFVSSVAGAPAAIEFADSSVGARTVNALLRTVVGNAIGSIPVVGGVIEALISGLWPDDAHRDQVWASAQNYVNQAVAGAYRQSVYAELNDDLSSLYNAARAYITATDDAYRKQRFENLYNLVNNLEPHFIHENTPEDRYTFIAPFVTLRLAALLENVTHYEYYYGQSEQSESQRALLRSELDAAVDRYRALLDTARQRIVQARRELTRADKIQGQYAVVDDYNGYRIGTSSQDQKHALNFYADTVQYALELKLDINNAIGQLWEYFRPGAVDPQHHGPLPMPTIAYRTGPYGAYNAAADYFDAGHGELTEVSLWSGSFVDALQLGFGSSTNGRHGGPGGGETSLALGEGETIDRVSGMTAGMITERGPQVVVYSPVPTAPVYEDDYPFYPVYRSDFIHALTFSSNRNRSLGGGSPADAPFSASPMVGTANTRLAGVIGYKSVPDGQSLELLSALICQWQCQLAFQTETQSA